MMNPAAAGQGAPVQMQMTAEQRAAFQARMKMSQTIYPQYIDASLTPQQGRRTTLQHAVPHPTIEEMFQALQAMGFKQVICDPRKSLPRAQSQPYCIPPLRGCLKLVIKEGDDMDNRTIANDRYPNKGAVLRGIADFIKAIPNRQVVEQGHAQRYATAVAEAGAQAIVQSANRKIKKPKRQVIRGR